MEVSFPERTYGLGETIDLTIELMPHRDCLIREGRVDLMVEERWTERSTVTIGIPIKQKSAGGVGWSWTSQVGTTTEIREVATDHKETSAHSSVVFLESVRFVSGRPEQYRIRLEIQPEPPPNAGHAKLKWWLQTAIDVVGARDIKPRSKISIAA